MASATTTPDTIERTIEKQAENADIYRAWIEFEHAGFTGSGYVKLDHKIGSYLEWSVDLPAAKQVTLNFRFANGSSASPVNLVINGDLVQENFLFSSTGAWNIWQSTGIVTSLRQGGNTIRLVSSHANGGPNYDALTVFINESGSVTEDKLTVAINPLPAQIFADQSLTIDASGSGLESGGPVQFEWTLMQAPDYKRDLVQTLNWPDVAVCQAEDIGQRIRGYLFVPFNGEYKFSVASDYSHQLILNSSGSEQSSNIITRLDGWTEILSFEENNYQQSNPVFLRSGQGYYFELLHVHDGAQGHFGVAWKKPGDSNYTIIPSAHFSSIDEGAAGGPTGNLTRELFSNLGSTSVQAIKNKPQYLTGISAISLAANTSSILNFVPPEKGQYMVGLKLKGGGQESEETLTFFVEDQLLNGDAESGEIGWMRNTLNQWMFSVKSNCGVNNSKCFAIEAPSGIYEAGSWQQTLMLRPQTAYRLTAKIRGEYIAYFDELKNNYEANGVNVHGPRIGIHQYGPAKIALDETNPDWQNVTLEFATTDNGKTDIYLDIGEASGNFYIDDLALAPFTDTITRFEADAVILHVYNDILAAAGGQQIVQAHTEKVSNYIQALGDITGKTDRLACKKESAWMAGERSWKINPFGWAGNPIVYIEPEAAIYSSLVWPTVDGIDGIFSHEFTHNFEIESWKFGAHLSELIEIYGLDVTGLKRSQKIDGTERLFSAREWKEHLATSGDLAHQVATGCYSPAYGSQKLLSYVFDHGNGWDTIKKIMHDTWTGNSQWPRDPYQQYRYWWQRIGQETGSEAWLYDSLHTEVERTQLETTLSSLASLDHEILSPGDAPPEQTVFSLVMARLAESAHVGYDEFRRNNVVGQCQLTVDGSENFKGLFAHAPSILAFDLNGKWEKFTVGVAIHALVHGGNALAYVKGDGIILNPKRTYIRSGSAAKEIVVDVRGVNKLELEFDSNGSDSNDWTMWLEPTLTRSEPDNGLTSGKLVHWASQKCVSTLAGVAIPPANSAAVLTSNCNEPGASFELLANNLLKHVPSGMCMHPNGGSSQPGNATSLVFYPDCSDEARLKYSFTEARSLLHSSGSCIHPQGGATFPNEGTPLVFWNACGEERLRFEFNALGI